MSQYPLVQVALVYLLLRKCLPSNKIMSCDYIWAEIAMLKRILLLLGETPSSVSARRYALKLARDTGAAVAGLTGVDLPYVEAAMPGRAGAVAYATRLRHSLKQQAAEAGLRVSESFDTECRANGVQSESLSFEGDPIEALAFAVETHDLMITGHDTAFRGNVREQLSEVIANLLLITPRPIIVCPVELPTTSDVLVAYDGSFTAIRAVQLFASFHVACDRLIQLVSIDSSGEVASQRTARAGKYLQAHGYQVKEIPIASRMRPADVLKSEIVSRKIRTAVMGAYGHQGFRERLFGSTTSSMVKDPPCALFLYH